MNGWIADIGIKFGQMKRNADCSPLIESKDKVVVYSPELAKIIGFLVKRKSENSVVVGENIY